MKTIKKIRAVWAEIDLDALAENMREIRRITDEAAKITAVVKADGYGHGAIGIAKTLLDNGADYLAVAVLDEGIELRKAGYDVPILILGHTGPERAQEVVAYDMDVCVYQWQVAKALSAEAVRQDKVVRLHIKIDSGMSRIGYATTEDSIKEIVGISKLLNVKIEALFTHFSTADEKNKSFTREQYEKFAWTCERLKQEGVEIPLRHCANSAAIIDLPEYDCDMVRAGIILYGLAPSGEVDLSGISLHPVMTLKCLVTYVKEIAPGQTVSYGRHFTARGSARRIATLSIGYADGYTRLLSGKAEVLVHKRRAKIVGNICMDQSMIDVTGIDDVKVGDEVVLFGHQGSAVLPVDELADALGTIHYELVSALARRVPRVYLKNGEVKEIIERL